MPSASSPLDAESVPDSPLPSGVVGADVGDAGVGLRVGVAVLGAGIEGGLGDGSEVALAGFGEGVGAEVGFDAVGCSVGLPLAEVGALVAGEAVPQSKAPTKMPATAPFGPVMSPVPTGPL